MESGSLSATKKAERRQSIQLVCGIAALFLAVAMPNRIEAFGSAWFIKIPIELPLVVLGLLLVPAALRRIAQFAVVLVLFVLFVLKVADMAVYLTFARPFNPLVDVAMMPIAFETLVVTNGLWSVAGAVLIGIVVLAIVCVGLNVALGAILNSAQRGRIRIAAFSALLVAVATPVGTLSASQFLREHATRVTDGLRKAEEFRVALGKDEFAGIPADQRLTGLVGMDVVLIFVESYGHSTLADPAYALTTNARLKQFDQAIASAGFSARSAWLTSSTYGGESYLAHSSFLSGLWVDNRKRYESLINSRRQTLIDDFRNGGWRTVAVLPQITRAWPEGAFFGYDYLYDATNLGYAGHPFTYMTMPDQFTLAVFQQRELAVENRRPVFAEIALISSHHPWTPIPKFVDWTQVGDGAIFKNARTTETVDEAWSTPERIRQNYLQSIDYVLETLSSFITTFGNDNTLFIIVGDHQPAAFMARSELREVPVHILARDPARLAVLGEGWTDGMMPSLHGMITPMSSMRARIIEAFTHPTATTASHALAP